MLRRTLFAASLIAGAMGGVAVASPLNGSWTQVGLAKADDSANLFDGACNLRLSGCTFNGAQGDYWHEFAGATEILFITGDRQFWGQAQYADVLGLVNAATEDFAPNLNWISAGRNGVDLGAGMIGNILMRNGSPEDPWVTLVGSHCASGCAEVIWGESGYYWSGHATLMNNNGGLQVYARNASLQAVPEPGTLALVGLALAGLGFGARRR